MSGYPGMKEGIGTRLGGGFRHGDGVQVPGGPTYDHQEVFEALTGR